MPAMVSPCHRRRKDELPAKIAARGGILEPQAVGQGSHDTEVNHIVLMLELACLEMSNEGFLDISREDGASVLGPLAASDDDAAMAKVDVLHPKLDALTDAQTATVTEAGHELEFSVQLSQDSFDFRDGEDGGHVVGPAGAGKLPNVTQGHLENVGIDKDQSVESLVLGDR